MWLKDLFTKNIGLKLISLGLAIILWFMAVGREQGEVGLNVPLELKNIPPDVVIANQVPDGISVRIRGSVALTRQVTSRPLRFSLDLAGAKEGPNQFTLTGDKLDLPRGLEITRLTPSEVSVDLEPIETKNLGLLPVIKGEPVFGYMIEDILLSPKHVEVRGPKSVLGAVDILWTEPIDVTSLKESATIDTRPALPDPSLVLVTPTPIQANLKIGDKIISRIFNAVPVEPINTDKDYRLTPESVALTIKGPERTIETLSPGKALHVRVNLAGLEAGQYQRHLDVSLPPDVEMVSVAPDAIEITILEEKKAEENVTPEIVRH